MSNNLAPFYYRNESLFREVLVKSIAGPGWGFTWIREEHGHYTDDGETFWTPARERVDFSMRCSETVLKQVTIGGWAYDPIPVPWFIPLEGMIWVTSVLTNYDQHFTEEMTHEIVGLGIDIKEKRGWVPNNPTHVITMDNANTMADFYKIY